MKLDPTTYLDMELKRQGIPILGVSSTPTGWAVQYDPAATPAQIDQGNAVVAGFDGKWRQSRLIYDLYANIGALSAAQKQNAWSAATAGDPPLWAQDRGVNAADLHIIWLLATQLGVVSTVTDKNICRQMLLAIYTQDNPYFLVQPSWDTSINVPGLEPVP